MDAIDAGLNVMVFSDDVPLEHEIRLKEAAARRGTLVLGPDCETALIGGVGLGFANVVVPGPVGVVAASGTGAQQLICLLDAAGIGVSHCLGVGGRDLSEAVAGRSTRQALALLDADAGTELIVVIAKLPDLRVIEQLRELAAKLTTPVRFALLGPGHDDLTAIAEATVVEVNELAARPGSDIGMAVGSGWREPRSWLPSGPTPSDPTGVGFSVLRGAFAGGTLCYEAMLIAAAQLGPIASNIPLDGAGRIGSDLQPVGGGHAMVDFGAGDVTLGRSHPMIDESLRVEWIVRQEVGRHTEGIVLLLDVILGRGAHPDPAAELAPAIAAAHVAALTCGTPLAVVVSLCAAAADPQGLERQASTLALAGAAVHLSNAAAARAAVGLIDG
jgi:FdrA protein